jgi:hypothetical protein
MEKNVFFFSHNNPENSEDDSVSKYNMFEVRQRIKATQYASALKTYPFNQVSMIRDLVYTSSSRVPTTVLETSPFSVRT